MSTTPRVLLVEHDERAARRFSDYLRPRGFDIEIQSGEDDLAGWVGRIQPDVLVIDLAMPSIDGPALCKRLRAVYDNPIILLATTGAHEEQMAGLSAGADDLLLQPTHPGVLLAHIQARLRGSDRRQACADRIALSRIVIDAGRRAARTRGGWVDLTGAEFEVLWLLACRAGRCVPRTELCSRFRGFGYDGLDRSIDQRITRLRKKLRDNGRSPRLIKSVRGEGYLLVR